MGGSSLQRGRPHREQHIYWLKVQLWWGDARSGAEARTGLGRQGYDSRYSAPSMGSQVPSPFSTARS